MNRAEIISLILGAIGTLSGLYATWLSHKVIRQELTLSRTDMDHLRFRITNYSLRPIPIQGIQLGLKVGDKLIPSPEPLSIEGISLPGVLPPESCIDVQQSTGQKIGMIVCDGFILTVTTQTGRAFRLEGKAKRRSQSAHLD